MNVKKLDKALYKVDQMRDRKRRYAFEEYVRNMDNWYWNRTERTISEKEKKMTELIFTSTVISIVISAIFCFCSHCKSR